MERVWAANLLLCACGGGSDSGLLTGRPGGLVVYLNELMADNIETIEDDQSQSEDWIELYNAGDAPTSTAGLYLSDDLQDPNLHALPDLEIPAGGFLLLWADGEAEIGPYHLPFSLSKDGDSVGLYYLHEQEGGDPILFDAASFGPQDPDVSYGRASDGGAQWGTLSAATPGTSNDDAND